MTGPHKNIFRFDTIIVIIMALFSLEINLPYALDQLNFHQAMPLMGYWARILCPGDLQQNLILMGNQFMPYLLMVRTLTIALLAFWLIADVLKVRLNFRWMVIAMLIVFHVVIPEMMLIRARLGADNHSLAHDGGTIQMEESMKMVLKGQNPYGRTFHGTPLENWRGFSNNVIYHVPYMPGAFLFSLPVFLVSEMTLGCYDQRIYHLILYFIALMCLGKLCISEQGRNIALIVFALNPFFVKFFLLGANDIVIFTGILLAMVLFKYRWIKSGFLVLAGACAVKQFAWFFVPFLAIYAFSSNDSFEIHPVKTIFLNWRIWIAGLILFGVVVIPFMLADLSHFFEDTFKYGSGGLPTSYPMQGFHGYGFASLILFLGIVEDGNAQFPFTIFQLVTVLPLMFLLVRRYIHRMNLSVVAMSASIMLLVFMFFSRYLHGNFVGFIMFWPVLAWAMTLRETSV